MKDYHCCATCENFKVNKLDGARTKYTCKRLGFETKPNYKFDCWQIKSALKDKYIQELER